MRWTGHTAANTPISAPDPAAVAASAEVTGTESQGGAAPVSRRRGLIDVALMLSVALLLVGAVAVAATLWQRV